MKLQNQSIIVTGGASGIGYHAALGLAAEGANVIVADFNLDGAAKVAGELSRRGVKAFPFKVDVSKAADVEAMVDFAVEKLGTLNGIFNNAGIGLVKINTPILGNDPVMKEALAKQHLHGKLIDQRIDHPGGGRLPDLQEQLKGSEDPGRLVTDK